MGRVALPAKADKCLRAIAAPPELRLLELANALVTSELADRHLHLSLFHSEFQPSQATLSTRSELDFYDCRRVAPSVFATARESMDLLRAG